MKSRILFFIGPILLISDVASAACSRANLTRCLDSVCAINISSNPAARCQYCGTANAGTPSAGGMRNVSVGASAKFNISDKELKKAPTDPGQRYVWASEQCLKKVNDCTPDDVSDVYDTLIEQSCTAAGISTQVATLTQKVNKGRNKSSCDTDIRTCVLDDTKCGADWSGCKNDADFDNFFGVCSVESTGCEEYIADIRSTLASSRETMIGNASALVDNIVAGYQNARQSRLAAAQASCVDNAGRDKCIQTICANNMPNKCATEGAEKSMATKLCKFYELACAVLK